MKSVISSFLDVFSELCDEKNLRCCLAVHVVIIKICRIHLFIQLRWFAIILFSSISDFFLVRKMIILCLPEHLQVIKNVAKFTENKNLKIFTNIDDKNYNLKQKYPTICNVITGVKRPVCFEDEEIISPYIFSGLSTILRQIVLTSDKKYHYLLGNKLNSLKSVAEASPRTNLVDNYLPQNLVVKSLNTLESLLSQWEGLVDYKNINDTIKFITIQFEQYKLLED